MTHVTDSHLSTHLTLDPLTHCLLCFCIWSHAHTWTDRKYDASGTVLTVAWRKSYRVAQKMAQFFWYALALLNINRFSKLLHCQNQEKNCNNTITKGPTTPQVCRYTTLWKVCHFLGHPVEILKLTESTSATSVSTERNANADDWASGCNIVHATDAQRTIVSTSASCRNHCASSSSILTHTHAHAHTHTHKTHPLYLTTVARYDRQR